MRGAAESIRNPGDKDRLKARASFVLDLFRVAAVAPPLH
jgi:hypothetical protein